MSKLLRYYSPGNVYFITAVTHERAPILVKHYPLLQECVDKYRDQFGFVLIAHVTMPDHFHWVIDPKNEDLSAIIGRVKLCFSKKLRFLSGTATGKVWPARFWDHIIRDQQDLNRHVDYIHFNPVKHEYTQSPTAWQMSSFNDFVAKGFYSTDWGVRENPRFDGEFGE